MGLRVYHGMGLAYYIAQMSKPVNQGKCYRLGLLYSPNEHTKKGSSVFLVIFGSKYVSRVDTQELVAKLFPIHYFLKEGSLLIALSTFKVYLYLHLV